MLVHEQAHYLYLSSIAEENECFKKRSTHIAQMFTNLQNDITLTTNGFGYIYDAEILQDFATKHLKHYFIRFMTSSLPRIVIKSPQAII